MSSACTPHRLVGRRVRRKLASCFFARRIRLEKKTDVYSSRSLETSNGSIIFDFSGGDETERESREKSVQNSPSHSNRINDEPRVVDDDYLVFGFREDGAIAIIEDEDNHYEEQRKASDKIDEKRGENDESEEINELEDRNKMVRFESCDSNLLDTSSGSFAFPILKIEEWIGSPDHMPSHGDQSFHLYCCRL